MRRKGRAIATVAILLILGAIGIAWLNPRLTHHIESDHFRAELAKETAKGLHFPSGQYAPIHWTGFLSATSDGFRARNGRKAMKSMDAHGITARFNPLGFFLRRWQLDDVHIRSGEVEIQTYAPRQNRRRQSLGSIFFCRSAFTLNLSNLNRPTLRGVFGARKADSSARASSSRRMAETSTIKQTVEL